MTDTAIIVGIFVAVLGLAGTIGAAVVAARQKAASDLLNALQAEVRELRAEAARRDERIDRLERDRRVRDAYIDRLRRHIIDEKPPPPPDWPAGLS